MAYLYVRKGGRVEIREARSTPQGPRSRTLASFRGALTAAHLDQAESAAARPFDRDGLRARAGQLGIPVARRCADAGARALLAALRNGARIDPVLVSVLREQLEVREATSVPDDLGDVVEWLGATDHERGRTLRDVLRLYDTIATSREPVPTAQAERYPRFEVRPDRQAS